MEPLNLTTKLLGLEDPNIDIKDVVSHQSHMEIKAKLDYQPNPCPHCKGNKNFKTKILIALNIRRKKTHLKLSRC